MKNKPKGILEFSDTTVMIIWEDGHESLYLYDDLRQECPCATCRQLRSNSKDGKLPFKRKIPLQIKSAKMRPMQIESVGNYAYKFHWNDKHDTGIYTFDFLRNLCACEECSTSE